MPDNITHPTVITIITMLSVAVSAFFFDKVHATASCAQRRREELAEAERNRIAEVNLQALRVADLQARIKEVENDRDYFIQMTHRLAGILEEAPIAVMRKKE